VEFIDDHPVVAHRVRFRNRVEIGEDRAGLVKDDMIVVWLVRSRCEPPQYHPVTKDAEERYRFNIQAVEQAVPLDGAVRDQALVYLEHGIDQSYLDFGAPRFRQEEIFDPNEYGPGAAEYQIAQLARYLHDIGELREEETPVEAVRRLMERRAETPVQEESLPFAPEPRSVPLGPGEVEVLGSIYGDRRPASQALIEEAFGRS
jgi:hypothetical protein